MTVPGIHIRKISFFICEELALFETVWTLCCGSRRCLLNEMAIFKPSQ